MIRFTSDLLLPLIRFRDGTYDLAVNYVDLEVEAGCYVYSFPSEFLGLFELCAEDKTTCTRPTYIQAFPL